VLKFYSDYAVSWALNMNPKPFFCKTTVVVYNCGIETGERQTESG